MRREDGKKKKKRRDRNLQRTSCLPPRRDATSHVNATIASAPCESPAGKPHGALAMVALTCNVANTMRGACHAPCAGQVTHHARGMSRTMRGACHTTSTMRGACPKCFNNFIYLLYFLAWESLISL